MKVDQDAIEGIRIKVERAHEHFNFLYDEMVLWRANKQPWHFESEVHDNGSKHFYRLRIDRPIPIEWAVRMGEGLHDLRSALEQTVYWLTVDCQGKPLTGTGFPVNSKRSEFELWSQKKGNWAPQSGMYKIRGVGPGPQAFIKAVQPYPQRWRADYCFAIKTVHNLWNQDKHRLVHLFGVRFDPKGTKLSMSKRQAAECVFGIDARIRRENAIVIKAVCSPAYPKVEMGTNSTIPWAPAISAGRRSGGGSVSMWDVERLVGDIVNKLLAAIGRQTEPINLKIWSARWRPA
jgi:hypothetical protein